MKVISFLLGDSPGPEFCVPTFGTTVFHLRSSVSQLLKVISFLLGDSPGPEFCVPTFRTTVFHLRSSVSQLLKVISFLLGDSPGPEYCVPTFGTTVFHLRSSVSQLLFTRPMKIEQTVCPRTSAYKCQTSGYHPKERIQHIWSLSGWAQERNKHAHLGFRPKSVYFFT